MTNELLKIDPSDMAALDSIIRAHICTLATPYESWSEDCLYESRFFALHCNGAPVGYAAVFEKTLRFFYVKPEHFASAPALLEKVVCELVIERVQVMSQDPLLCALIAEWEYDKEKMACLFTDARVVTSNALPDAVFRTAEAGDIPAIRRASGDFFDGPSGGYASLEQRISEGLIFVLEEAGLLLGCGIAEKSRLMPQIVSIGMSVVREQRRRGAATRILTELKSWAASQGLTPVAGCWYYNTLSRRSLEASGMVATGIVSDAVLRGKEKPPLRTGNPPGELVE